jgi:hypothetical protein
MFEYFDVVLVLIAGPIVLLVGAPAAGYGVGAAAWIIVRAFGIAVDRGASSRAHVAQQLALRIGYRFTRVFLLTFAAVLAIKAGGKPDGLTSLLVFTVAFTVQLSFSILGRATAAAADASAPGPSGPA